MRTRGVKVMLFNPAGELLLIRNSYGNRAMFVLPGGGIGRGETPAQAAAREIKEEIGLAADDLEPIGVYQSAAEGKRDTISLYKASARGNPAPASIEIEEARYFPLDGLPDSTSPATVRRVLELQGKRSVDGRW